MPSSIGISPLSTVHPMVLHDQPVRSSSELSPRFNLTMDRSPGFGSCACDQPYGLRAINPRFHFGFSHFARLTKPHTTNSLAHSSIGTPSPNTLRHRLRLLVSLRFQVLFHLPNRDAFHLSLTVLVHYRSQRVFSLGS